MAINLLGLSYAELENWLIDNGEKKFHAQQIFDWIYRKRVNQFEDMSNLSLRLREKLMQHFVFEELEIVDEQISRDGTHKFLFRLHDGHLVESVLMMFDYGHSACLTTQVGCNMGCTFCASGLLKKQRNLEAGEIVAQAYTVQKALDKEGERLGNLVLMGIGEPFDNYDNVMKALSIINHVHGLAIGARHITISTCGVVPMIRRFADEGVQYNLAISLHASNDKLRSQLMPIDRAFPLQMLMSALDEYAAKSNRRLTFEYLLLNGINDTQQNADELQELMRGRNAYINLIPYNSVKENDYTTSTAKRTLAFYDMLKKRGVAVTLRQKKGDDIDAACGQLRANHLK